MKALSACLIMLASLAIEARGATLVEAIEALARHEKDFPGIIAMLEERTLLDRTDLCIGFMDASIFVDAMQRNAQLRARYQQQRENYHALLTKEIQPRLILISNRKPPEANTARSASQLRRIAGISPDWRVAPGIQLPPALGPLPGTSGGGKSAAHTGQHALARDLGKDAHMERFAIKGGIER